MPALEAATVEQSAPKAEFVVGYALAVISTHLARRIPDEISSVLNKSGAAEAKAARSAGEFRMAASIDTLYFDQTNPQAVLWASEASGKLITRIAESNRAAIRGLIARSFNEGIPTDELARMLRSQIGLTVRQANAVMNLREKIRTSPGKRIMAGRTPIRVPKAGASAAFIEQRTEQYSKRLLNHRARMIARTETIAASGQGQLQLWQQAEAQNLMPPGAMKEWIVTPDDRLCQVCASFEGETALLKDEFPTAKVDAPPAHVMCRCAMGISAKRTPSIGKRKLPKGFNEMIAGKPGEALFKLPPGLASNIATDEIAARAVYKQMRGKKGVIARLLKNRGIAVELPYEPDIFFDATEKYGRARIAAARTALEQVAAGHDKLVAVGARKMVRGKPAKFRFSFFEDDPNMYAHASSDLGIEVNLNCPVWQSEKALRYAVRKGAKSGFHTTVDIESIIVHEYGHLGTSQLSAAHVQWANADALFPGAGDFHKMLKTARKVSRYARESPAEFVAECFAGQVSGVKYPDDVMSLYRAFGGPNVPKPGAVPARPTVLSAKLLSFESPPEPLLPIPPGPLGDVIRRVLHLWGEGKSYAAIAREMGWGEISTRPWEIVKRYKE